MYARRTLIKLELLYKKCGFNHKKYIYRIKTEGEMEKNIKKLLLNKIKNIDNKQWGCYDKNAGGNAVQHKGGRRL